MSSLEDNVKANFDLFAKVLHYFDPENEESINAPPPPYEGRCLSRIFREGVSPPCRLYLKVALRPTFFFVEAPNGHLS
jgi:hypothetical protein